MLTSTGKFYMLCSTPRVGSALLCNMLTATGVAGKPVEYFNKRTVSKWSPMAWGIQTAADVEHDVNRWFEQLECEHRAGGWFGLKAHFNQFKWAYEHGLDIRTHFPDRAIMLTRGDVLGQAISFARAEQTRAWNHQKREHFEPTFDADLIGAKLRLITESNVAWETFFADASIEPHRVCYESFCADMEGELRTVLRFLDLDTDALDLAGIVKQAQTELVTQRDSISAEWKQRYLEHLRVLAESRRAQLI